MTEPEYAYVCVVCGHLLSDAYRVCGSRCYHALIRRGFQ